MRRVFIVERDNNIVIFICDVYGDTKVFVHRVSILWYMKAIAVSIVGRTRSSQV
jgi:hypothetical protein